VKDYFHLFLIEMGGPSPRFHPRLAEIWAYPAEKLTERIKLG
jgi:hypothetical protein